MPLVGVMGYQGGSALHLKALEALELPSRLVHAVEDLEGLTGLILPGGESSVQYRYCVERGFISAIASFAALGKPILGTCAGAILLSCYISSKVTGFGLLDIQIERNVYGRQVASGLATSEKGETVLFIRAPGITAVGPLVEILDSYSTFPILVKKGQVYAATYHPEALVSSFVHRKGLYSIFC